MSEFVGGYHAYRLLLEDAAAYEDVLIIMAGRAQGDAKAQRIAETQRQARGE